MGKVAAGKTVVGAHLTHAEDAYLAARAERLAGRKRAWFLGELYRWWIREGAPPVNDYDEITPQPEALRAQLAALRGDYQQREPNVAAVADGPTSGAALRAAAAAALRRARRREREAAPKAVPPPPHK